MKKNSLYLGIAACTLAIPFSIQAQDEVEELVVTGSHIKRDKFEMASPVEVIDAVDVLSSGYTNIGSYIRDLTYTQNVDTVANVLGAQDGGQDSNSARFNLRGLGTSSTLTLFDGRRVVSQAAVAGLIPDIAMARVEIILDGGAATYGTDAIAGVVNMIPVKNYDGTKVRGFYTVDAEGDSPEPKISILTGKTFGNFNITAAVEYSERKDALYRSDRPEYLAADSDTSPTGNPGSFSVYGGGNPAGGGFRGNDPQCGQFNGTRTDDSQRGSFPSGGVAFGGFGCTFEYGEYQDSKRPNEDLIAYVSTTYEVSDNLTLQAMFNFNDRTSTFISSPSTGERGSNNLLLIPSTHPNNIFPVFANVSPRGWRPFTANDGATIPSHLDSHGSNNGDFDYQTAMFSIGAEFNFGDTSWSGSSWMTRSQDKRHVTGSYLNLDNLTLALQGMGGVNGNQWFNPFGSASPLATSIGTVNGHGACETGTGVDPGNGNPCSRNDQGLVNWLYERHSFESRDTDAWSWEGVVTGDLFELPAGPVAMAVGAQYRYYQFETHGNPLARTPSAIHTTVSSVGGPASLDYNTAPTNGISTGTSGELGVKSLFTEFDIPILDNLTMILALRYEDFQDFDLTATVPKVSFRWEPIENLSLRTSYGEGFLAPTVTEITFDPTPGCAEAFTGTDPFLGGTLVGILSCSNGNPGLSPEESEVFNVGFTWKALDGLELSLDYQKIDYQDRIIRLSSTDTLNFDLANFYDTNGLDPASYAALSPADQLALRSAWFAPGGGSNPDIIRDLAPLSPNFQDVAQVTRAPQNIAGTEITVLDFRVRYSLDMGDFGYLAANLATTYYVDYDFVDPFGNEFPAERRQNANTNLAPPLPEFKHNLRLAWLKDGHNVALSYKNSSAVYFDATAGPTFGPVGLGAEVPNEIDEFSTVDIRYSYEFDNIAGGRLDLGIGSNNVTNNKAQPLPVVGGLETRLQDSIGRTYYVEGTYSFD